MSVRKFKPGRHPADFRAAPWCRGPHLQTIFPFAFRRVPIPAYRRERLELDDGDFLDLDWLDGDGPTVVLLHGLEGCSQSTYIMGLAHALRAAGYSAVVLQFRSCSGTPNRLQRTYHAGDTGDIDVVMRHVNAEAKSSRPLVGAVGYSLGGNAMLKWMGEQSGSNPTTLANFSTAVAVSVPYKLGEAAQRMNQGFSRVYQRRLVSLLHAKTRSRLKDTNGVVDLKQLATYRDFKSFDHHVTAPLHGFSGVDDYYARSSSLQFLRTIKLPTLLLHATDDPFMTHQAIPEPEDLSASVRLELAQSGGHVGFVAGRIKPVYWLEQRIISHFRDVLNSQA